MTVDESQTKAWTEKQENNRRRLEDLNGRPPGGTSGGMAGNDPIADHGKRIWRLEAGLIASFLFLIAAIGGLYLYVGNSADKLDARLRNVELSTQHNSDRLDEQGRQFESMDKKLDAISDKLDRKR